MTSTVTISAHCGDAKEVHVVVADAGSLVEEFNIANGEKAERYAYDDRVIAVREVVKVDRRAKEIEDAEFSLRQATLRYEDAASRGFPLGNEVLLKADVVSKHDALEALTAPVAPKDATEIDLAVAAYPIPDGVVDADPLAAVFDPAGHALMTNPVPATETKTYTDGSTATGPGPLPDQSPAEQEAAESGALPAESKAFLDSLDPVPAISDGTTDSVEGPTES